MVAILGSIIPAPFAKPVKTTSWPATETVRIATLGRVSVVIMASAVVVTCALLAEVTNFSMPLLILSRGSWGPILPVEQTNTSSG